MKHQAALLAAILALPATTAFAAHHEEAEMKKTVTMYKVNEKGMGDSIGELHVQIQDGGVVIKPMLMGLTPGLHGFHVHENGSCAPVEKDGKVTPAGAAGSHLNLSNAEHHDAPWAQGHTGDMPALFFDANGKAEQPIFAPKLTMAAMKGKAIIIHEGGDNYSDSPKPLGGGGARVACGIVGEKS